MAPNDQTLSRRAEWIRWLLDSVCVLGIVILAFSSILNLVACQINMALKMFLFCLACAMNALQILRKDRQFALMLCGVKPADARVNKSVFN